MPDWLEVTVVTSARASEAVAAILHDARGGVVEDAPSPALRELRTYLPLGPATRATVDAIRRRVEGLRAFGLDPSPASIETRVLSDQDWAAAWKAFFHPLRIGRRLVVKPTWETYDARPGDLVVEIDPGMAFGTGQHPSTALALELLEGRVRGGETVADLGTGSGILAIAAARLGARRVVAVDNDPLAVEIARANVAHNRVGDRVSVTEGHLLGPAEGAFDVIAANIIASVMVELLPRVPPRLAPGGALIASGVVADRLDEVIAASRAAGLAVREVRAADEWRALVIGW